MLGAFGWSIEGRLPNVPKCVAIAAPHTSNWDFWFGIAAVFALGLRVDWIGKHTLFRWPFGYLMRWIGGTPVARESSEGRVGTIVDAMARRPRFVLGLSPEGTRRRVERWKTGFYHVAHQAGVPILLGYFDYGRKVVGLGPLFEPTGDLDADVDEIRGFYDDKRPKYPDRF
jgi:1-acyl-sn-glycerol-3-phosphate acyltransferase